jgi:hypothetical protein
MPDAGDRPDTTNDRASEADRLDAELARLDHALKILR